MRTTEMIDHPINSKHIHRIAFLSHVRTEKTKRLFHGVACSSTHEAIPLAREFNLPPESVSLPACLREWAPQAMVAYLATEQQPLLCDIRRLGIPLVHTTNGMASPDEAVVLGDAVSIYECAHDHFADLGIRHVVRVQYRRDVAWDISRAQYEEFCLTRGYPCHQVLIQADPVDIYSPTDAGDLPEELKSVLDPRRKTGLFTQQDFTGPHLVRSLVRAHIPVPDQVAVMGIDDFHISLWCQPPMTTVRLPIEEVGLRAGALALAMIDGAARPRGHIRIPGAHLVLGGSTKRRKVMADMSKALRYLDQHACEGITVRDVVLATQSVTRQTFTRQFQQWTGRTPGSAIRERQLEEATRMLRETDKSITVIALACGFCDDVEFRRRFRRVVGMSPRTYRKSFLVAPIS